MPDYLNEELGRRIRSAREGKMTQAALGDHIGLSRTAVTNIECGRQRLLVDQLVEIARALQVSASDLLPPPQVPRVSRTGNDHAVSDMPTVKQWLHTVRDSTA